MRAVRFRDLVKIAGTPEPKSLWTEPKHDREFMRAVKEHRVLTVRQESGKKDFGELGFHRYPGALYFVFPKSLPTERGKVVGIKYDLAGSSEPKDVIPARKLNAGSKMKRSKSPEPQNSRPVVKIFRVAVRRTAMAETDLTIEASSKSEARAKVAALLETQDFDPAKAKIRNEIRSVN